MHVSQVLDAEVLGDPGEPERTLVVSGELDLAATAELERAVETLCREGVRRLTIDLQRLSFMDCAGFATLVSACEFCNERGCVTTLVASDGPVRRVIGIIEELNAARGHRRLPDVLLGP